MKTKGILLSGGSGSRLYPLTVALSKQILPVYNKPMIFYPLATLMSSGIKEILIISNPEFIQLYKTLLGNGEEFGINIQYKIQERPAGIAQSLVIAEEFIGGSNIALILGDNIYYMNNMNFKLQEIKNNNTGATVFACQVRDPQRYGVVEIDAQGVAKSIEEKPKNPKSNYAVTGLYFYDNNAIQIAKNLKPSNRGELEITDVNNQYLSEGLLKVEVMQRGSAWFDAGTHESLLDVSNFIHTVESRQGIQIGNIHEVAYQMNYIGKDVLIKIAAKYKNSSYGEYLYSICNKL
jgi:glucose-1-phosphate thymidylyltransferase